MRKAAVVGAIALGLGLAAAPGAARAQVMGFMEVDSARLRPMTQAQCFAVGEQMLRELGGRNISRTGSVLWADLDDALVGLMCRPDLRHVLTATNADTEAKLVAAQRQIREGLTRVFERR
jgi:hypothetical protein